MVIVAIGIICFVLLFFVLAIIHMSLLRAIVASSISNFCQPDVALVV